MLTGFFTTLSDDHPKQMGLFSLIKGNPGTALITVYLETIVFHSKFLQIPQLTTMISLTS